MEQEHYLFLTIIWGFSFFVNFLLLKDSLKSFDIVSKVLAGISTSCSLILTIYFGIHLF